MRAGAQRIATARGEMPGSRAWSRASRSSKIGAALACRIPTRPSGGEPRASFSTAWSCAMRAMASSPARPCRSACPGGGHGRPSPCGRGALWTGALWTGSPVAPPVRDPWRTDLRRTCRARRCIARRCHGRGPASRPPRPAPRTDRSLRARLRTLADVAGAGEVPEPGMADRCPFRDPACARIPRGAHPSTIPCASGPGPGRPRSMGRDGSAACAKVSQPGHAKRGRTMRSTTDRPIDGPTVPRPVRHPVPPHSGSSPAHRPWTVASGARTDGASAGNRTRARRPRPNAAASRRSGRNRRRRWSARLPSAGHDRGSAGAWARPRAPRDGAAARSSRRPGSRWRPAPAGAARWSAKTCRTDGCDGPPAGAAASPLPGSGSASPATSLAAGRRAVDLRRSSGRPLPGGRSRGDLPRGRQGSCAGPAGRSMAKHGLHGAPGCAFGADLSRLERCPIALRRPPVLRRGETPHRGLSRSLLTLRQHRRPCGRRGDLALLGRGPDGAADQWAFRWKDHPPNALLRAPGERARAPGPPGPLPERCCAMPCRAVGQGIAQHCPRRGTISTGSPRRPRTSARWPANGSCSSVCPACAASVVDPRRTSVTPALPKTSSRLPLDHPGGGRTRVVAGTGIMATGPGSAGSAPRDRRPRRHAAGARPRRRSRCSCRSAVYAGSTSDLRPGHALRSRPEEIGARTSVQYPAPAQSAGDAAIRGPGSRSPHTDALPAPPKRPQPPSENRPPLLRVRPKPLRPTRRQETHSAHSPWWTLSITLCGRQSSETGGLPDADATVQRHRLRHICWQITGSDPNSERIFLQHQ